MTFPLPSTEEGGTCRLDLWLWHARICATRTACARLVSEHGVRINSRPTNKPAAAVHRGDVLTLAVGIRVRVLRVEGFARRRGGATEAARLFAEILA